MSRKCSINLTKSIDMTAAVVYYDDVEVLAIAKALDVPVGELFEDS